MYLIDDGFQVRCLCHGRTPFDYLLGSMGLAGADKMSSMAFSKHSAQMV
jgi:hypothetical protein